MVLRTASLRKDVSTVKAGAGSDAMVPTQQGLLHRSKVVAPAKLQSLEDIFGQLKPEPKAEEIRSIASN